MVGALGRRRGSVSELRVRGSVRNVEGEVPLAEAFGYATDLRSLTQGRGTFTLEFSRYDLVPEAIAERVVERRRMEGRVPER